MSAGKLNRRVAFDAPVRVSNGAGGATASWNEVLTGWAEFRYQRGGEQDQGGGQSVAASFKVRIRSNAAARALTGENSMRDLITGDRFNIRQIDAISDRAFVWLVAESGVAN